MNTKWFQDNDPCDGCLLITTCVDDCDDKSEWRRLLYRDLKSKREKGDQRYGNYISHVWTTKHIYG